MSDETAPSLREQIIKALTGEHYRRSRQGILASPEIHSTAMADAALAVVQPELDQVLVDLETAKGWRDAVITERDLIRREAADLRRANTSFQEINTIRTAERDQLKAAVARVKALATTWAALAPGDDWADNATDTVTADCGRAILAALDRSDLPAVREFAAQHDPRKES